MSPPDTKHYALRQQIRFMTNGCQGPVPVRPADMLALLEYIDELERDNYAAWRHERRPR